MRDDFDPVVADRFTVLDQVPVPDIWRRVQQRAAPVLDGSPLVLDRLPSNGSSLDGHRPRRWAMALVGVAAGTMLVVLLLSRLGDGDGGPRIHTDVPPVPTVPTAPTSGVLAPTDVTAVGNITWTRLDGDASTQPESVVFELDGAFYGVDQDGTRWWRSTDGVAWTRTQPLARGRVDVVDADDSIWGVSNVATGRNAVLRWNGTSFDQMDVAEMKPPGKGLVIMDEEIHDATAFGGGMVAVRTQRVGVPWAELFDIPAVPDVLEVETVWDAVTGRLRLFELACSGSIRDFQYSCVRDPVPFAVVRLEVVRGRPDRVDVVDAETGAVVTSIAPRPDNPVPIDVFREAVAQNFAQREEFLLAGADGVEAVATPWPTAKVEAVIAVDDRLVAVLRTAEGLTQPGAGWELWTSADGRAWEQIELPTAGDSPVDSIRLDGDSTRMFLTTSGDAGPVRTWVAEQVGTWSPLPGEPFAQPVERTDFGWVRHFALGGDNSSLAVSVDGVTWQDIRITIPPPDGRGTLGTFTHGDTIFITSSAGGRRTMWVGVVDNS